MNSQRLSDRYTTGQAVEITFGNDPQQRWWSGFVMRHDPPGIWVRVASGQPYFVTNTRRIRPIVPTHSNES